MKFLFFKVLAETRSDELVKIQELVFATEYVWKPAGGLFGRQTVRGSYVDVRKNVIIRCQDSPSTTWTMTEVE